MSNRDFPPITPGEILEEEFLLPMELSQYRVAKDIHVSPRRINVSAGEPGPASGF
jgi:plasmid maintenance system antidote protein VapI